MPVIPTAAQTDAWYALPADEHNRQTLDQFVGNMSPAPPASSFQIDTPGGTGSEATTQQATSPATPDASTFRLMGSNPIDAGSILGFYQKYLGRTPSQDEVYYASGHPGGASALESFIANSAEAQQATARKKVMPIPTITPNAAPSPTQTPYDGSQALLLNAALQRLTQLQQPIDHSNEDLFAKYALDRVGQLSGAPFTDTQNASLLTQHMAPLTQARDTAKQQAAVDLSRRGFTPESGVFQDRMKQIDLAYQRGVANVTNTLNVQGIDQNTKNQQLQLQILSSLVDMGRMSRQEADQRSQQIVTTAALPFNTDLQTLAALTSASGGDNASSLISSLLGIGGLNLKGTEIANQNDQANSQAIGSVIGYILNNHSAFGF
jgi:hypothetical protein